MEKRKFPRVRLSANSTLSNEDAVYQGYLENISLSGALIRFGQSVDAPLSGEYSLTVYIEDEDVPLRIIVEVVCATYTLTGIKFLFFEADVEGRLQQLVRKITSEQLRLRRERERFQKYFGDFLREH